MSVVPEIPQALLVPPRPVIKVSEKLQQPNPGRTTDSPDNSGMKGWVTATDKEPQPAEVFAESNNVE